MADNVFNIAKGQIHKMLDDNSDGFGLLLLTAEEAAGTAIDHDTISAFLGAAGNTEATFTNYARKTAITATKTVDDTNDRVDIDIPDQVFTSAGNASNETVTSAVVFWDPATGSGDASLVPVSLHTPASGTLTNGTDLTVVIDAVGIVRIT